MELKHVSVRYGEVEAINDVSLYLPRGSFTALVGESGSGKSTIIRAILGMQELASGDVFLDGLPCVV